MNKKVDEWWKLILLIVCACIFTTIILNLTLSTEIPNIKIADNVWVGFWGSLIGAIIGGSITLIGIKMTIDENRINEEENKKFNVAPYLAIDFNKVHFNALDKMLINCTSLNIIDYKYAYIEMIVVDNKFTSLTRIFNDIKVRDDREPLLYILEIENNGLNNAVYVYIDEICFSDDIDGESSQKIENNDMNELLRNNSICSGIKVGEKIGIVLGLYFNEADLEKTLYMRLKYNDLLGNEYIQKVNIRVKSYNSYENRRYEIVSLEKIEYPDGKIIKLS